MVQDLSQQKVWHPTPTSSSSCNWGHEDYEEEDEEDEVDGEEDEENDEVVELTEEDHDNINQIIEKTKTLPDFQQDKMLQFVAQQMHMSSLSNPRRRRCSTE